MIRDLLGDEIADDDGPLETTKRGEVVLTLVKHAERARSLHVSEDGDENKVKFLPLSQISVRETDKVTRQIGKAKRPVVEVTMPEWLAKDRGLI